MRKLIAFLALALGALFAASAATAAVGKPFLKGVKSPSDLASRIELSLAKDPSGKSMLDPAQCKQDGSCASPIHYLEALQRVDPGAHLTKVAEIPVFLRTLRVVDAPAGEYWISCLKPQTSGGFQVEIHCLSRTFKSGEKAWVDARTNRIVFASDCTNVVEKQIPVKTACVEIAFTTKPGDLVVRFALMGPENVADDCVGVKKKGQTEFARLWKDDCPDEYCGFIGPSQVVGQSVRLIGSYVPEPGEHVLRLPARVAESGSKFVAGICLERVKMTWPEKPQLEYSHERREEYIRLRDAYIEARDKWIAGHSDTIGVRWHDYLDTGSGVKRATVYYTREEIPSGKPRLYIPWGDWFQDETKHRQYWDQRR